MSTVVSIIVGIAGTVFAHWLTQRRADQLLDRAETQESKAMSEAAMLASTKDAQVVQARMEDAVAKAPPITDLASLRKAFGMAALLAFVLLLPGCESGHRQITAGEDVPLIKNPPPPAAMFTHEEIPLNEREKAAYPWANALYQRVTVYDEWAVQKKQKYDYFIGDTGMVAVPHTVSTSMDVQPPKKNFWGRVFGSK